VKTAKSSAARKCSTLWIVSGSGRVTTSTAIWAFRLFGQEEGQKADGDHLVLRADRNGAGQRTVEERLRTLGLVDPIARAGVA
jgi:hypothetical protein